VTAFLGFIAGISGLIFIKEPERGRFDILFSVIAD
jgi:hypothetical protein